jgi:Uma2 family endonuclease
METGGPSPGREALEHKLTQRDLDFTPDDGNRYEVIDGELFVSPFPSAAHQQVVAALVGLLWGFVRERTLGKVFSAGLKVVLDEPTGVGPDVVYISNARLGTMREDGYYGPPDLIVEVLSSKPQLDRFVKLNKYERAGVPHYWIVDPERRRLDVYRLEGSRYALAAERSADQTFEPELFPGLTISLRDLWM